MCAHCNSSRLVVAISCMVMHAQIIEDAAVHEQYSRVITPEPAMNEETEDVCALLQQCLDLRRDCCHALPTCHTQAPRGALRMTSACVQHGCVRDQPGLYLYWTLKVVHLGGAAIE